LPAGTYTLVANKTGYITQNMPGVVIVTGTPVILNINLTPALATGTVSGTITLTGMGVMGASVSVQGFPALTGITAPAGNYTILNVPAGLRGLLAQLPPPSASLPQTQNVTVTGGGSVTANFSF